MRRDRSVLDVTRAKVKAKDPALREEWFRLVRSLDNFQPSHNKTWDTILKPPQQVLQKVRYRK